ncbi:hypothetical protein [Methylobacterium radiotolerans]
MSNELLLGDREGLLAVATADTVKWCAPPAERVAGKHLSDQHWMRIFDPASGGVVDAETVHRFLVQFQLTNRVVWDKPAVAAAIERLRMVEDFDPVAGVTALAEELRACNTRGLRQTSAASKLSVFAKPSAEVFIWDALASLSALLRDRLRGELRKGDARQFLLPGGGQDYAAFHAACARALAEERGRADFRDAVAELDARFRGQPGPMGDRDRVPLPFVERRLLDKLMFWEGHILKYGAASPAAGTSLPEAAE